MTVRTHLTTQSGQAYSAANGSNTFQTLSFANSNGVSFSTGTQGIYASVATAGAAQTGISGLSAGTTQMTSGTAVFSNSNGISFGVNGNTVTASYTVPSVAGLISAINVSGGTTSNNLSAITFSNSNGVSFGLNGSVMTATVATNYQAPGAYLTTAALSQDSSKYAGTNGAITGGSITVNTSGVSINLPAYLTTAMQSNAATISNINVSGGTTSSNLSAFKLVDSNGVSWSVDTGSKIYATVKTDYQSSNANYLTSQSNQNITADNGGFAFQTLSFSNLNGISFGTSAGSAITASHNGLTTAMASNRGSDFVQANAVFNGTNASGTIASNNISVSVAAQSVQTQNVYQAVLSGNTAGAMATISSGTMTIAGGNNITVSQNGNAFTISGANVGGAQTGISGVQVGNATYTSGTVTFQNANGISFGSSGANGISASYTVPSTAGLISAINVSGGTTSNNLSAITFSNSNGVSFGLNGSVITATVATNYQSQAAYLTTAGLSGDSSKYLQNWRLTGNTAGTTSSAQGTDLWLAGGNGVTISGNANTLSFSVATNYQSPGAYLTTARASNDAVGLNTAQSNVTWTVNSSGISFDGRGYAGTGTTFGGTNISASATLNSNGLNFSLSVANPGAGGAGVAISAGGSNFTSGTVSFGNSNGVSFITINGSVVASVGTAPAGSLIFANANGVSFSTSVAGASTTVSASVALNATVSKSYFMPFGQVSSSQQTNSQVSFRHILVEQDISFSRIDIPINLSLASSAAANTGNIVFTSGAVLYTRNGAILSPIVGVTGNTTYTWASNTANYSSIIGGRFASFGLATALTPGEYWLGVKISTTNNSSIGTATTLLANTISMMIGSYMTAQNFAEFGFNTSASTTGLFNMQGLCSVDLTNTTQTYQQSQISVSGAPGARANIQAIFRNY